MAIYLRRTTLNDLDTVMMIIEKARILLKENGNPQWQDGYPFIETIRNDIRQGYSWVLIDEPKIVGTAVLQLTPEQIYAGIKNGTWANSDAPYATIHRVAALPSQCGQGLGKFIFSNLITVGYLQGMRNFRYDTHYKNIPVQKIGKDLGFVKRGTIYRNDKHMGFELNLAD